MTVFPGLAERLAASVLSSCTYIDCAKNEIISSAGSVPSGLIALKQGLAGAYVSAMGEDTLVSPITPGVVFETRLNRSVPSIFTYRALSPTRLLKLSEDRFQEFLQNPEFAHWCSANQYRNFTMLTRIGAAAAQKNTDRKILVFVEGYLESYYNRPLGDAETAEWLLTQSHVSDILGITRTHLNARLSTLAKQGIMEIRRRQIVWRRPASLMTA
jgi:CRP-like cAMP-binding protein